MSLIIDTATKIFDTVNIKKGYLIYAKHRTWPEGKSGFVTAVKETELTVQYHPGISNVTNHFFLPVKEVSEGEWEIRWSEDMKVVNEYPTESDIEGGAEDET